MTSPNTIIADMQAEIDALRKDNSILFNALVRLEKEFRFVFPIYYYSEPWSHEKNECLKYAQNVISSVK